MNKKTTTKNRLTPRSASKPATKLVVEGDGAKAPVQKKATYYIEKTPIQGSSSEITNSIDESGTKTPLMTQAQASAEMHRLHSEDPRASYDVIRRSDGIPFDHVEADYSTHIAQCMGRTTSDASAPPQVVPRVQRPSTYVVEVDNIPLVLRSAKGRQSGRILCGRTNSDEVNPTHDRLRDGESRVSVATTRSCDAYTTDIFSFDTWAGLYYFCVDIKEALRSRGYKSSGNYQRAIWIHTPPKQKPGTSASQPQAICTVTAVTHLNKVTSPDYKVPQGHAQPISATTTQTTQSPTTAVAEHADEVPLNA